MAHTAPLKILKASAGSGKTFSLTLHYIALLLSNEYSYKEILAVTFTNKATAEMKERILSVLQQLATADSGKQISNVRQQLLAQFPQWTEQDIAHKAYRVYRRILHDYGHFTVSTIDGFSQKVIRSFTYELNLDAAYQIEMNTNKVKSDLTVMLNMLLDERPDLLEWIINYAKQQIDNNQNWNYRRQLTNLASLIFSENFQEFDAHLVTADSQEIFELLHNKVQAFTKAYLESVNAAIRTFREIYQSANIDVDAMYRKSQNRLVLLAKTPPEVQKCSSTEFKELMDKYLSLRDNESAFTANKSVRHDLIQLFTPVLEEFEQIEALRPQYNAYRAVQGNLYYLRLLKEMSDLLVNWRKENSAQLISDAQLLLNKLGIDQNEDPTFIWEKIGNRYNYFLFDEFQDTSRIQWKNYSPLLLNALSNSQGKQHEHLIVGDVKQSIYRWRNGDWRILLQQVEEQITGRFHLTPESKKQFIHVDTLKTNYRSLPRIIAFNNYLYERIPQLLQNILNEKVQNELSEQNYQWWIEAKNNDMLVRAYENSAQLIPADKQQDPLQQGSVEVCFIPVDTSSQRTSNVFEKSIENLCEKIKEWISSGRYEPKQIGILVRSNAQALSVIEQLLDYKRKENLTFEVISGDVLHLATNDAVNLILETLRALVYSSDKHTIHNARVAYLYARIHHNSEVKNESWLKFKHNDIHKLKSILPQDLLDHWETWRTLSLVHLVEKFIELYNLATQDIHLPYLLAFKDLVEGFSSRGERGITAFLTYWEEDGHNAVLPSNGKVNAIEVTTIHKSKGLAYDVVMLPFCSWKIDGMINGDFWVYTDGSPFEELGKIPLKYSSSLGNSIFYRQYYEEVLFNYMDALNTLYVATTRAVEHLYITAPGFKETEDKATKEKVLDVKNELISDLIHQVLYQPKDNDRFRLEDGKLLMDQPIHRSETSKDLNGSELINNTSIAMTTYPLSDFFEKTWSKTSDRDINTILMMDKAARYGVLAHEVMAEVREEGDIEKIVSRYIADGLLAHDERDNLLSEIQQIWNHPQINNWLSNPYKIWNESAIITSDGETIRPDKVFTSPTETIVLDFKFTTDNTESHVTQVKKYIRALVDLGYKNVRGYLLYAKADKLMEVL